MARPVPVTFGEKYHRVQKAVGGRESADRRHFDFTGEVEPGVRLVLSEAAARRSRSPSGATRRTSAELCSDASVPATAALLAIDGEQARRPQPRASPSTSAQFTRSQSRPDVYYTLFDYASRRQIHTPAPARPRPGVARGGRLSGRPPTVNDASAGDTSLRPAFRQPGGRAPRERARGRQALLPATRPTLVASQRRPPFPLLA